MLDGKLQLDERDEVDSVSGVEVILKASADNLRLGILQVLRHDSYGVLELCNLFDVKQSAMSHHLKILAQVGLVATRREGNAIFYRRGLPAATTDEALVGQLFVSLDAQSLPAPVQHAVDRAQQHRSECSRHFFSEYSEKFKAQQDLIAPIQEYSDTLNDLIDTLIRSGSSEHNGVLPTKEAVEIGPGEGAYLIDLSQRFEHVIALDNAESMLARCRRAANKHGLGNIGFIHGDTNDLLALSEQIERGTTVTARKANCVVANMVLHHNASPQKIFEDVSQILSGDGVFFISELCLHSQEWVRDAAGDVWLGFSEAQLCQWARGANLQRLASVYTALRNGFRIQIHAFAKSLNH